MTIKASLREIKYTDMYIQRLQNELDDLRQGVTAIDYGQEKFGNGPGDLSQLISKIEQYEKEIARNIDYLVDRKTELRELIDKALKGAERVVIQQYYFNQGSTWEQIAVDMNYTYRQIQRLHGKALCRMEEYLKKMS